MLFVRKYDPAIHHRKSIRLRGYDYSRKGRYFITLCCQGREQRFGHIENGVLILNDAGHMIDKWFNALLGKFTDIALGACVIMPNHFHAIIINTGIVGAAVRADLRVRPDNCPDNDNVRPDNCPDNDNIRPDNCPNYDNIRPEKDNSQMDEHGDLFDLLGGRSDFWGGHVGPPQPGPPQPGPPQPGSPLPRVIQWFKTMTTNEYIRGVKNLGWERFDGKLWQRDYYEHIIRDEKSYLAITNYIINNPANWKDDEYYR